MSAPCPPSMSAPAARQRGGDVRLAPLGALAPLAFPLFGAAPAAADVRASCPSVRRQMTASLRSARSLRSLFRRSCPPRGCVQRGGAPPLSPVRLDICDGVRQPRQTRKFFAQGSSRFCPRQLPVSAAANDRLAPLGALAPLAFPPLVSASWMRSARRRAAAFPRSP